MTKPNPYAAAIERPAARSVELTVPVRPPLDTDRIPGGRIDMNIRGTPEGKVARRALVQLREGLVDQGARFNDRPIATNAQAIAWLLHQLGARAEL